VNRVSTKSAKKKDNVDLICDIGELSAMFHSTSKLDNFLQNVVTMIAEHMHASVCSIFMYDEKASELLLSATVGLNPESVGKVRLALGEGLAGLALKELRPILEDRGSLNPKYKFVPDIGEEKFHAYLAVPVLRGLERLGVIVLEHTDEGYFDKNDEKAIRAIAAQLSSTIQDAQLFINVHNKPSKTENIKGPSPISPIIHANSASGGIAMGKLEKFEGPSVDVPAYFEKLDKKFSIQDFYQAIQETEDQISDLQQEMDKKLYDVASLIFSSHLLILKDDLFSGKMEERIKNGTPPEKAIAEVMDEYVQLFSASSNPRIVEKVQDIKDLSHRLLSNLKSHDSAKADYKGHIVVAKELLPSDLLKLVAQNAAGIIIIGSSMTAHISILAKSLSIPVIFTTETTILKLPESERLLIDGDQATIFINPDHNVLQKYEQLLKPKDIIKTKIKTCSADNVEISLLANVNLLSEISLVKEMNAKGIGLYRSEFPFILRNTFPSEEEQYRIYRNILEEMENKEVTLRTLDVGGDKMLSYYSHETEANPFLGLRAIRFSLRNLNIFSQQLRAMLRAGLGYELKIMFPLISSLDDFLQAKKVVNECIDELKKEGTDFNAKPLVGVMIELPSAAEVAGDLATHADFISIGTNDLVQYILGVDRTNEKISDLYLHYHPAVLRTLKKIMDSTGKFGHIPTICGEMATDEKMIPFLLGIGVRKLSVSPQKISFVQQTIEKLNIDKCQRMAGRVLDLDRLEKIAHEMGFLYKGPEMVKGRN
jgi:phosphotransferase system, enzyme I, PtsP